ncbi:MAG: ABC transporter ATP-binding protein [Cellulosilyticaceae bacterium]
METYAIETDELTKIDKHKEAVGRVCMHVKKGEIYGLVGPVGSGKSTLIGMIIGVIVPTAGSISFFETVGDKASNHARSRIGVVMKKPSDYPKLTVMQNMELVRLQKGIPGKHCIVEMLERVGLNGEEATSVEALPRSMRQKLSFAMALLGHPEILILEEPFNQIEKQESALLKEFLVKLKEEQGVTVLISSQSLGEVYQWVDSYGMMHQGRLVRELTKEQLEEKCQRSLELQVDSVGKSTWVCENVLQTGCYKVVNQNTIRIYEFVDHPVHVVQAIVAEGVKLTQITTRGDALEDYYEELIGGERHA